MDKQELKAMGRGIAIRATLLGVGAVVVGAVVVNVMSEIAGAAAKFAAGAVVLGAGAGFVTWEAKKLQKRMNAGDTQPALG